jgi:hypothetical protein
MCGLLRACLRVFYRMLAYHRGLASFLNHTHEPVLWMVQHNVLPHEHAHADARKVETVEKLTKVEGHSLRQQYPVYI